MQSFNNPNVQSTLQNQILSLKQSNSNQDDDESSESLSLRTISYDPVSLRNRKVVDISTLAPSGYQTVVNVWNVNLENPTIPYSLAQRVKEDDLNNASSKETRLSSVELTTNYKLQSYTDIIHTSPLPVLLLQSVFGGIVNYLGRNVFPYGSYKVRKNLEILYVICSIFDLFAVIAVTGTVKNYLRILQRVIFIFSALHLICRRFDMFYVFVFSFDECCVKQPCCTKRPVYLNTILGVAWCAPYRSFAWSC